MTVAASETLSTANLDYLQRVELAPGALSADALATTAPPELRRMLRIAGVGRSSRSTQPVERPERIVAPDLLVGVYGYKIPLAFLLRGDPGGVAIELGTWAPPDEKASPDTLEEREALVRSVLDGLYPAVEIEAGTGDAGSWPNAGLVLGVPTANPSEPPDLALPIDRLVRAMAGGSWAALVLAQPVDESATNELRHDLINEMREAQSAAQATAAPSPLADHYESLLDVQLKALTEGLTIGAWRTAVYLLGDAASYFRLGSVWRSTFAGERSLPEGVRVWDGDDVRRLAASWAMPDLPGAVPPGRFRHPFASQTLLTSAQLAAYVHLPRLETSGFRVSEVPEFDVEPPVSRDERVFALGSVLQRKRATTKAYAIGAGTLTRHAFVAGVTGSGKTNTVFHLLAQAAAAGIPFLVLEPAKAEYRALSRLSEIGDRLRVFTLGRETVSPLRLNPFEVLPGIPVAEHLDLLRAAFAASFGMWTPLPQLLERCLHEVYVDRGWDLTTGSNSRLDGGAPEAAFPTLSDLVAKVDDVAARLGYEERVISDLRAALQTRLDSLRAGGKGRMFDVRRSIPMDELLAAPTVLELEGIGDDDDKAFAMGLLLVRLLEHRRAGGEQPGLRHLVVVEEAHRLLTNVGPRRGEEEANPRGKAVETFTNLLAEIRAYGQGVIVADQVPVRLAPDVIKNTGLKIAHRVVAIDDREVLGGTMAMDEAQARSVGTLATGQAAVFSEGDDRPILVAIPLVKDLPGKEPPTDGELAQRAQLREGDARPEEYELARSIVEAPAFRRALTRVVLAGIEDPAAFDAGGIDLRALVDAARPPRSDGAALGRAVSARAAEWFAERRGAAAGWTYAETAELADRLRDVLVGAFEAREDGTARNAFRDCAWKLHTRTYDPYPDCFRVCTQQPPVCLYRAAAADLIAAGRFTEAWEGADGADIRHGDGTRAATYDVCLDAGFELVASAGPATDVTPAQSRAGLCFAQQMLFGSEGRFPSTSRKIVERLLREGAAVEGVAKE